MLRARCGEPLTGNAIRLVDVLLAQPIITARVVETHLQVQHPTALRMLDHFVSVDIIEEMSQEPCRQGRFSASGIVAVIEEDAP